jgi:hypothetical protein
MSDDDRDAGKDRSATRRIRRWILGSVVVLVVALALAVWRISPMSPGPTTPAGATPLHIATEPAHLIPNLGCPSALLAPVRLQVAGDDLITISLNTGDPVSVVWPSGWVAWRLHGLAELRGRDGSLIARESDVIADRFGGGVGTDDVFHVCVIGG